MLVAQTSRDVPDADIRDIVGHLVICTAGDGRGNGVRAPVTQSRSGAPSFSTRHVESELGFDGISVLEPLATTTLPIPTAYIQAHVSLIIAQLERIAHACTQQTICQIATTAVVVSKYMLIG